MSLREELIELIGGAVWVLAVEIQQAKEDILTTLDEVTTRIQTDINNVLAAVSDLRAQIAAAGNTGADVTALNASAQQIEDALGNASATLGQVTDTGSTATADTGGTSTDTGTSGSSTSATS